MGLVITAAVGLAVVACLGDPVWGLCAYIVILIFRPNELVEGVKVPAIPVMVIMMSLAYALHMGRITPRSKDAPAHRSVVLMVAMIGLLMLHLVVSPPWHPVLQIKQWTLAEFAPDLLLMLYMTRHITTFPRLQGVLGSITVGSSMISLDALFVHFLRKGPPEPAEEGSHRFIGHGKLWNSYHLQGRRLRGKSGTVWGNSNDLGMVTNWAILGCLYFIKRKGSKVLKGVAMGLTALLGMTLLLTGSRGGLMQLGINLWMVFVGGKRKVLGIVLMVIALVGVMVVLPRLAPQRADADASKDERTQLVREGYYLFRAYPIQGCGYLTYPEDTSGKRLFPHNVYVQALAETGIIGSSIFFALIFFLRRETSTAVKYYTARDDLNMAVLAQCIGALQLSYSVFILFSNQFMTYRLGLVMSLAMALFRTMSNHLRLSAEATPHSDDSAPRGACSDPGDGVAEAEVVQPDSAADGGRSRRPRAGRRSRRVAPARVRRESARSRRPSRTAPLRSRRRPTPPAAALPARSTRPTSDPRYVFDPAKPDQGVRKDDEDPTA